MVIILSYFENLEDQWRIQMLTLIRNGTIYAPESLGRKDILLSGNFITAVSEPGEIKVSGVDIIELDAAGKYVLPGFIDSHVHILGGGGEGGPTTRAPEIRLEDIIFSGVTTLIGCLGTDGITRHMQSLLAKANGLEEEGITCYIFSGSYEIPVKTLTGSVRSDLILIDKVIGAGEIAISDHRSSQPTFAEFSRLAAECRVGGMLGGKAGILHCHMGDGKRRLELIFRLLEETEIPPSQVIPTHANRNPDLLAEAVKFIQMGGYIDLTADLDPAPQEAGHLSIADSIRFCQEHQASIDHITISSDSNGSLPVFDQYGELCGLTIATQKSLLANFVYLVKNNIITLEQAAGLFATNPAVFYRFANKGEIKSGKHADIIMMNEALELTDLISKGKIMLQDGNLQAKGTFSQ